MPLPTTTMFPYSPKAHFEIHITVDCFNEETLVRFQSVCEKIGAKCIAINLGPETNQIMSSKTFYGDIEEVFDECLKDKMIIRSNRLIVDRVKIEAEQKYIKETNRPYLYYEIHVPCRIEIDQFDFELLECSWYKSHNLFKPDTRMITCRERNLDLIHIIDRDIEKLKSLNLIHSKFKHHYEFAIVDSNKALDAGWIH